MPITARGSPGSTSRSPAIAFWSCAAIFVLNDFAFIALNGSPLVYAADYSFRVAILLLIYFGWRNQRPRTSSLGVYLFLARSGSRRKGSLWVGLAWAAAVTVFGLVLHVRLQSWLHGLLPETKLFGYPGIAGIPRLVDLSAGMALIALSEEGFARGLAFRVFGIGTNNQDRTHDPVQKDTAAGKRPLLSQVFSWRFWLLMLIFGIGHWSNGLDAMLTDVLIGAGLGASLIFTGSLWPGMTAHFLMDFVIFGGLV